MTNCVVCTEEEGHTTVVVEATCDHSGRIIAATKSYPGAENDKTVIARDKSIWRMRDEEPWKSFKYKLYTSNGTEVEHEGAWLIVDGGYPKVRAFPRRVRVLGLQYSFVWLYVSGALLRWVPGKKTVSLL